MAGEGQFIVGGNVRQDPNGDWIINVYLCNPSVDTDARLRVTSHPYDDRHRKIGAEPEAKEVTLPAATCTIVTFGPYPKDRKPRQKYSDVYIWKDGHWVWDGWDVGNLASLLLPPRENERTTLAFVAPLPFPWRFVLAGYGPQTFSVKRITGLPRSWRVSFVRPVLGQRFRMAPETKHWPLIVEISTKQPVKDSTHFDITVEVGMSDKAVRGGRTLEFSYPITASLAEPPPPDRGDRTFLSTEAKPIPFKILRQDGVVVRKS